MTSESEATVDAAIESRMLPVDMIDPSPRNRKCEEGNILAMAESINGSGMINPIMVRPKADGRYEIVCGEYRWRAHLLLGRTHIDARTRELDEDAAQIYRVIENLSRSDPSPLELGDGIRLLLEKFAVKEVAGRLARSVGDIRRHARLANLSPAWRGELAKPDTGHCDIAGNVGSMIEIAILPPEVQDEVLASGKLSGRKTTAEVKWILGAMRRKLETKPWPKAFDRGDAGNRDGLPRCDRCFKHTGNDQDLFALLNDGEAEPAGYCLDASCWDAKTRCYARYLLAQRRAEDPRVLALYDGYPGYRQADEIEAFFGEPHTSGFAWRDIGDGDGEPPDGFERRRGVFIGGDRIATEAEVWFEIPEPDDEDGEGESAADRASLPNVPQDEKRRIRMHNLVSNFLSECISDAAPPEGMTDRDTLVLALCHGVYPQFESPGAVADPRAAAWGGLSDAVFSCMVGQAILALDSRDNEFAIYCRLVGLDPEAMLSGIRKAVADADVAPTD